MMGQGRYIRKLLALVMSILLLTGCMQPTENKTESALQDEENEALVHVLITESYGSSVLKDKWVPYTEDFSVLEYIEQVAQVETAYGGGFVNSIDNKRSAYTGQGSPVKEDWFFYVNGIYAHLGALDYYPQAGDVIHWDYHNWDKSMSSNANLSGWPAIFLNGYDGLTVPVEIVYEESLLSEAESIYDLLTPLGITPDMQKLEGQDLNDPDRHTILLCSMSQLKEQPVVGDTLDDFKKRGLFLDLRSEGIGTYDPSYENRVDYRNGGAMFAQQKSYAEPATIFVLTGTDQTSISNLVSGVVESPEILLGKTGLLYTDSGYQNSPWLE